MTVDLNAGAVQNHGQRRVEPDGEHRVHTLSIIEMRSEFGPDIVRNKIIRDQRIGGLDQRGVRCAPVSLRHRLLSRFDLVFAQARIARDLHMA